MRHFAPRKSPFHTTIKPVSQVGAGFVFIRFYLKHCMPTVYASLSKLAYLRPEALSDENIAVFSSCTGYLFISPLHILYIYTHPAPCFHTRAFACWHGLYVRTSDRSSQPGTHIIN